MKRRGQLPFQIRKGYNNTLHLPSFRPKYKTKLSIFEFWLSINTVLFTLLLFFLKPFSIINISFLLTFYLDIMTDKELADNSSSLVLTITSYLKSSHDCQDVIWQNGKILTVQHQHQWKYIICKLSQVSYL